MGLPPINNGYYEELGERWYTAQDDPVALLRAEAAFRNQYLAGVLRREGCRAILDVGCGAGFLCNPLAREGFDMTGLDVSAHSLEVARRYDDTGTVRYAQGTGEAISFADETFDAVCCMDVLEHVDSPARVVSEMARVLRPGGLLAAYTINRTWLAWLIVIKGIEWFVQHTPPHMHVYHLLVRPSDLQRDCEACGLRVEAMLGVRPVVFCRPFWRLLRTGIVPSDFRFTLTRSLHLGYLLLARKPGG